MRLFIPNIGTKLILMYPWTFDLYDEYRNTHIHAHFNLVAPARYGRNIQSNRVTIPSGSILKIDRVYIKKGLPQFNSITFGLFGTKGKNNKEYRIGRFWAKLDDVNNIECEVLR